MATRALILDLDGTIWDSHPLYARLIESRGGPDFESMRRSLRTGGNVARLLRSNGLHGAGYRSALRHYRASLQLYPSVRSCLTDLQLADIPVGIVTSLPSWIWQPMVSMAQIEGFVSVIEGSRRSYSKASSMEAALRSLGVKPSTDVWYVGDLESDSAAARAVGLSFAWASWGYSAEMPPKASKSLTSFRGVLTL